MKAERQRDRLSISARNQPEVVVNDKRVINFCSNDYLGLTSHPTIIKALMEGANRYGLGSGASAIVSGYFNVHREFEEAIADYLNHERALLFASGYAANISLLRAIVSRHALIASDRLCHASILDGIQLSRAKHKRFSHHDFKEALALNPQFIITESIFGMEGDITPLDQLINLTNETGIKIIVDTAHSAGLFAIPNVDYTITPLGKTFASMGATISGKCNDMEAVLQGARAYHYSTAMPPAIAYANLAALKIIQTETWRKASLEHLIAFFNKEACSRHIPLMSNNLTPIKTILINDNQRTMQIRNLLLDKGYWIAGIRPPTVPTHTARLRISLSALHSENNITQLLDEIAVLL
jgi:8-amino-7-oxononanoate synthase